MPLPSASRSHLPRLIRSRGDAAAERRACATTGTMRFGSIALIPMTCVSTDVGSKHRIFSARPERAQLPMQRAAVQPASRRTQVEHDRFGAGRHRRDDDDEVEADVRDEVGVRGGVRAAVDVSLTVDHDRSEEARDRGRRLDRGSDVGLRRGVAAEHDPRAVAQPQRGDPQRLRRASAPCGAGASDRPSPLSGRDLRARARRAPCRDETATARRGRGPRASEPRGTASAHPRAAHARRLDPLHPLQERGALGRQRLACDAGGEVMRRQPRSQRRADSRACRRAHDHRSRAGIPAGHLGDRRQRAGVVGVTDHATGTEHEADGRHVFNGRMRVGAF